MAGKNINVKLTFQADASAAKREMASLQQNLSNLATKSTGNLISPQAKADLTEAKNKAIELKIALLNATNVNTGKLNFTKFSQELKRNKQSLQSYTAALAKLGPQGAESMLQLSRAIRTAETPLISLKGKVAALGTTLMNTVKWQISSSITQGAIRAFASVIDYSKELNESLNNIRIVTGKSEQDMAKFAKSANNAAKALSTTTKNYTDASLIYFQQGLNSKEVEERTKTTIKLANVVGESAETVSEWMTAIWNNFDDGSRALENYADVLAKLGAATASSADEIAGGLEKFAAVADTVNLSFDYAAAALATITAETRQSEDVVGTALKTIFARVENLKLGKNLEDGTTLGQYSAALASVGVNIKDANGSLRDMDVILDDIGATWGMLNKDQQVALAQSVAGIRQYNQFIALMDNWDVMEKNVKLAKESNGALEQMNVIYSQGIEGATARVNATLEETKNILLDENDLIPLLNVAQGFLDIINDLLEAFGGLPGILTVVASLMLKIYGPQVAAGLNSVFTSLSGMMSLGGAAKEKEKAVSLLAEKAKSAVDRSGAGENESRAKKESINNEADRELKLGRGKDQMAPENYQALELKAQVAQDAENKSIETGVRLDQASGKYQDLLLNSDASADVWTRGAKNIDFRAQADLLGNKKLGGYSTEDRMLARQDMQTLSDAGKELDFVAGDSYIKKFDTTGNKLDAKTQLLEEKQGQLDKLNKKKELTPEEQQLKDNLTQETKGLENEISNLKRALQQIIQELSEAAQNASQIEQDELKKEFEKGAGNLSDRDLGTLENTTSLKKSNQLTDKLYSNLSDEDQQNLKPLKTQRDKAAKNLDKTRESIKSIKQQIEQNKQAGKSTADLEKQLKSLEQREKSQSKTLQQNNKELAKGIRSTKSYTNSQEDAKKATQKFQDATEEVVDAKKDDIKASEEAKDAQKNFNQAFDDGIKKGQNFAQQFTNFASGIASAAAGFNMMRSAIDSLTTSIAEGTADWSDYLSAITSIGFAIPMLVSGIKSITDMLHLETVYEKASIAVKALKIAIEKKEANEYVKNAWKKMGAQAKEKISAIGTAIADWARLLVQWPAGTIAALAMAVPLAAIGVAVGGALGSVDSVDTKKENIAKEEAAEQTNETAKKIKEEYDKNGELVDSYLALYDAYKKTGEGKDKILEAARKVANAYKDESMQVQILSGNYKELTKSIEEARIKEAQKTAGAAKSAINANDYQVKDVFKSSGGIIDETNRYRFVKENAITDESVFDQFIAENPEYAKYLGRAGTTLNANAGTGSSEEIYQMTEAMKAYQNHLNMLSSQGKIASGSSTIFEKAIGNFISGTSGELSEYEENRNIYGESSAIAIINSAKTQKGKSINEVSNFSEFLELINNMGLDTMDPIAKEFIENQLSSQQGAQEFNAARRAMEQQISDQGNNSEFSEKLKNIYTTSSDAMLLALANTDITKDESWESFEKKVQQNMLNAYSQNKIKIGAEYKIDEKSVDNYTRIIGGLNNNLTKTPGLLDQVTAGALELNGELKKFGDIWDKNVDDLFDASDPLAYAQALTNVSTGLGKMFNTDTDLTDFVNNNKNIISEFMNGDLAKFADIQTGIAQEIAEGYGNSVDGFEDIFNLNHNVEAGTQLLGDSLAGLNGHLEDNELAATAFKSVLEALGWQVEITNNQISKLTKTENASLLDSSLFKKRKEQAEQRQLSLDEEIERYYKLDKAQESLERRQRKASSLKDYSFGAAKLEAMRVENENLEKQLNLAKEYEIEAQGYLDKDKQNLIDKYGASFDEYGNITNYEKLVKAQVDMVNSTVNNDDAYNTAKKAYNQFKEDIGNYENSLVTLENKQLEVMETTQELRSNALASIVYTVELKVEASNRDIELIEWLDGLRVDNGFGASEKMASIEKIFGSTLKSYQATIKAAQDLYNEKYMDLNKEEIDQISTWISELYKDVNTLWGKRAALFETFTSELEAWGEKLDRTSTKISSIRSGLDSYKNIIDLTGQDRLGITDDMMQQFDQVKVKNSQAQLSASQERLKAEQNTLLNAQKQLEEARKTGDKDLIQYWAEQVEILEDRVEETRSTVQKNWSTALQDVVDAFTNEINRAADAFEESVSGVYGSIADMEEAWNRQNEVADRYLSTFEEVYEINKLNRNIMKQIETTDNVSAQRKLKDLMVEANELKEAEGEMSRNDLEYLQKKYDLKLAEIALEEAQNAKSQVKLQRDSQGNFGYVYTANDTAVDNAQQKYEDALYNYEKYADSLDKKLAQQYINLNKQMSAEIREMASIYGEGTDEFLAEKERIMSEYSEDLSYIETEYKKLTGRNLQINSDYGAGLADAFNQTYLGRMVPDQQNFSTLFAKANGAMEEAMTKTTGALSTMETEFDRIYGLMGTDTQDFKNDFVYELGLAKKGTEDLKQQAEQDAKDMDKTFNDPSIGLVAKTGKFATDFTNKLGPAKQELERFVTKFNELLTKLSNPGSLATDKIADAINKLITPVENMANKLGELLGKLKLAEDYKMPYSITDSYRVGEKSYYRLSNGDVYALRDLEIDHETNNATIKEGAKKSSYYFTNTVIGGKMSEEQAKKAKEMGMVSTQVGDNAVYTSKSAYDNAQLNAISARVNFDAIPSDYTTTMPVYSATGKTQGNYTIASALKGLQNTGATLFKPSNASIPDLIGIKPDGKLSGSLEQYDAFFTHVNVARALTSANEATLNHFKSLDTGGYTGTWGPEGRLALLHQKEIVLNAHDTENFLSAIELVRNLSERVDLTAASQARELAAWRANVGSLLGASGELAQNIVINAEFPAATDRYEIEEAFKSLALQASQYASKN